MHVDIDSTFYIVDKTSESADSGYQANGMTDPAGVFFGVGWDKSTLWTINSSTGFLVTADPGQTSYSAFIEAGNYSEVQIGTPHDGGEQIFISCSVDDEDALTCSADGGYYSEFMLDGSIANSSDFRLYFVAPGTSCTYAHTATLGVQYYYAPATPSPPPTKFWVQTSEGWAVDFGANSSIYAGSDYGHNGQASVFSIDNTTSHLITADASVASVAYIDTTSTGGYAAVKLAPLPLGSSNLVPLICEIATDGSLSFSCSIDGFHRFWLDLGKSTNYDYTLYIGTDGSTGKGTSRAQTTMTVAECTTCDD
ncbi:hypothetical protein UCRPC4_g05817 [Phaeomoniella chlamydospora]|uniref:Uncharacterized protein n=1 Tax=Phaeomoniella chlamydospora TaxID=158046 RepID=A0A0G2E2A9_PHACM|nr:hypothetical protein UCRPC4_g05817 [Phaeomoniella chlamydospora]